MSSQVPPAVRPTVQLQVRLALWAGWLWSCSRNIVPPTPQAPTFSAHQPCWHPETRGCVSSEDSSCLRKHCCCKSLKRFTFQHPWESVSGPSYCVDMWQPSVLILSGLFVITSWQALLWKSVFMLPILLLPNVNSFRTPSPEQDHFQIISGCLAADGPQTCILNENYHTRSAGGRGVKRSSLLSIKSHKHQVLHTELKQLYSA